MATAGTTHSAGTTWTNYFTASALEEFTFNQTANPVGSDDGLDITFYFAGDSLTLKSEAGIDFNAYAGTIIGLVTPLSTISGLDISVLDFVTTAWNGDTDGFNNLIWHGNDTITGGASDDLIRGFGGNDLIYGGAGTDMLFGGAGADRLFSESGNDSLYGEAGNDRLDGGAGNDRLLGGTGSDRITGGSGTDVVYGGTGADVFVFNTIADFAAYNAALNPPFDTIKDFTHDQGDVIDLSRIDANAALAGNQAFQFIGDAAFAANSPGTVRVTALPYPFVYMVELNTNNDAKAEATLLVVCPPTFDHPAGLAPVAGDFVL
jgi:Ca2+-binding RTX toxin-like protein